MKKNLNRRKIFAYHNKTIVYVISISLLFIFIFFIISQKSIFYYKSLDLIENFSNNFEYQFTALQIKGLEKVDDTYVREKLNKYLKTSIFLLPLDKIKNEIKDNNWIKNIRISTNYKNTVLIEVEEYVPLGIYNFNNKKFYFDKNGKIIEEVANDDNLKKDITNFYGQSSNLKANIIINILNKLNFYDEYIIIRINYIENRRWDIILKNNIKLMLSEDNPKKSIENFIIIRKSLSNLDYNNISSIDLRNINKTIITNIE